MAAKPEQQSRELRGRLRATVPGCPFGAKLCTALVALAMLGLLASLAASPRALRAADLIPAPAAGLAFRQFDWHHAEDEDATVFRVNFVGTPKVRTTDELAGKQYLYLDFYGVTTPNPPAKDWALDNSPIHHVKQVYYAENHVLRFVFYARPGAVPRWSLNQPTDGAFRLLITPVKLLPLGEARKSAGGSRKLVVLDPGHGGPEVKGCNTTQKIGGRTIWEEEVTLQIANKLAALIRQAPNMDVTLTRTDNSYVSLEDRIKFADAEAGDLFLSIHMNASDRRQKTARGFEIYYLSDWSKETNRTLVALENDAAIDKQFWQRGDTSVRKLLKNLSEEKFQEQQVRSKRLCEIVSEEMRRAGPFRAWHRGVKSAPFRVLMNYNMPTALAECGFLDTPAEARGLTDPDTQQRIAILLFNGINRYFAAVDPEFTPNGVAVKP